jgi:hypothetical protein
MSACAEALHLNGPTWVGRFLSLLKLPDDVQHLIDWGRSDRTISLTAMSLSRLIGEPGPGFLADMRGMIVAMNYERMEQRAAELEAEVGEWFAVAEATDAA